MKEVAADWVLQKNKVGGILYHTFEGLCEENDFIGFIPKGSKDKYMIVQFGGYEALAVKPNSWYTHKEQQKDQKGHYFIFDTANELLDWMKEQ